MNARLLSSARKSGAADVAKLMSDDESDDLRHAVSTSHLLHRAQQLASDRFAYLVGEEGITLRQFVVMAELADKPGVSQIDLVRATGIDRSTLADIIARLEERALILRKQSETDARAKLVELTPAGLASLNATRQHARAADAAILDALPRTKRKALLSILVKLSDHADKLARKQERDAKRQAKRDAKKARAQRKKEKAETAEKPPKTKSRRKGGGRKTS